MPRPCPEGEEAGSGVISLPRQNTPSTIPVKLVGMDGSVSVSLETGNGLVPWAQLWKDKGPRSVLRFLKLAILRRPFEGKSSSGYSETVTAERPRGCPQGAVASSLLSSGTTSWDSPQATQPPEPWTAMDAPSLCSCRSARTHLLPCSPLSSL